LTDVAEWCCSKQYNEDEYEDDHDEDDQIMVDAENAGKEAERAIGLNDSGMYTLGTVITKQFDEGCFNRR
jgi:hypothetical protein